MTCRRLAFTKDSVYLKGVMEIHVLLNVAIRDNQPQIIERLFAGRLMMSDVVTLGPYFESGFLLRPRLRPAVGPGHATPGRIAGLLLIHDERKPGVSYARPVRSGGEAVGNRIIPAQC